MKTKEIREIETADLQEQVVALQEKLEQMKLNHAVSPLENPMQIRQTRRDIARMKTILRERELNK
jgi:large subunit ribosomal protein L29